MFAKVTKKRIAAGVVLLALLAMPAPLLPPHRFAQTIQSALGISWKLSYLVAAVGLYSIFYGSLGVLATFVLNRAPTWRGRVLQIALVPCVVVGAAVIIRSLKLGHVPVLTNA